jgi:hypothetical protein
MILVWLVGKTSYALARGLNADAIQLELTRIFDKILHAALFAKVPPRGLTFNLNLKIFPLNWVRIKFE